jgi:hypothetical protein
MVLEKFAVIFTKNNMAGLKSDYYVPNINTYEAILNNLKNAKTENKVVGTVQVKKNHSCRSQGN